MKILHVFQHSTLAINSLRASISSNFTPGNSTVSLVVNAN
ncbi:hypothetical protein QKA_2140 [Clostridioides difficile DA00165]|nr:hypothetical protein QKA_2140 [Clostridioides difficile DA00165]